MYRNNSEEPQIDHEYREKVRQITRDTTTWAELVYEHENEWFYDNTIIKWTIPVCHNVPAKCVELKSLVQIKSPYPNKTDFYYVNCGNEILLVKKEDLCDTRQAAYLIAAHRKPELAEFFYNEAFKQ